MRVLSILIGLGVAAFAAAPAQAGCGNSDMVGTAMISCERNVRVIRQMPKRGMPTVDRSETAIKLAKIQQQTEFARLNTQRAIASEQAMIARRNAETLRYRAQTEARQRRNVGASNYGYGSDVIYVGGPRRGIRRGIRLGARRGAFIRH